MLTSTDDSPVEAMRFIDPVLLPIAEKVIARRPLSQADGEALYATHDVHGVGRLANLMRERLHGDKTFYNRNRHINYTNVCALSCKFCSFYRKRGEEGAYEMTVEQIVATARGAADAGATEVHIVGGLHPWQKLDYYLEMIRGIRRECPQLHVKAFTAVEIVHLSRVGHLSIHDVLVQLKEAGLGSLPGGGAEIFDERVHGEVFKGKVGADMWFGVHRTAHDLGLYTNATILYGHVETVPERVGHFIKLRELQADSLTKAGLDPDAAPTRVDEKPTDKAFLNCIIPLSFIPDRSELGYLPGPTGLTDLRTLAISRLMLHNIPHIKAFWIMQGIGLSQLALSYGVDDLDGTVVWYDITKREGEGVHQHFHVNDIQRLIREAGRTPIERDTLYHEVLRDENDRVRGIAPHSAGAKASDTAHRVQSRQPVHSN